MVEGEGASQIYQLHPGGSAGMSGGVKIEGGLGEIECCPSFGGRNGDAEEEEQES